MQNGLAVLVVDDIEAMRKVTAAQLSSLGIERIYSAGNGREALRVLQAHPVDVVLCDWNMPEMDGLQLLAAMRADERYAGVPFVMITAEADRSRIEEAIALGVNDLLVKPYSSGRLDRGLQRALALRQERTAPPVPAAPPPASAAADPARLTILMVDDRPDNLHLLINIFKSDYRIQAAHTGEKALDLCRSDSPPDLVLLDVMMPGMDGFEVARQMRAHPRAEGIPVIFVTAAVDQASRDKAMGLGAIDFVPKPVDPPQLRQRVDNFMQYVRGRHRLQEDYDCMLRAARLREHVEDSTRNDISGPLADMLALIQSLMADKEVARRHSLQLKGAERGVMQLLDMISVASELYKIETGRFVLAPQPVPLGEVVRRVVELARARFAPRRIAIAVDSDVDMGVEPPRAIGDVLLTYALLQILVRQACEASADGGRVTVTLQDADPLRVAVTRSGTVPPAARARYFGKYQAWEQPNSTGLGAYAVQRLAEAQHGQADLQVSDEQGATTVTVSLPREAAAGEAYV